MNKYVLLLILVFNPLSVLASEAENSFEVKGYVINTQYIEAERKDGHDPAVDNVVGSMFGVLGDIVSGILSTKTRAYYVYKINTEDDRVFEVSSRAKFNINDCVIVIYPKLPGGYPESGIDSETKLKPSTDCVPTAMHE